MLHSGGMGITVAQNVNSHGNDGPWGVGFVSCDAAQAAILYDLTNTFKSFVLSLLAISSSVPNLSFLLVFYGLGSQETKLTGYMLWV